jgi:hypothetical protein
MTMLPGRVEWFRSRSRTGLQSPSVGGIRDGDMRCSSIVFEHYQTTIVVSLHDRQSNFQVLATSYVCFGSAEDASAVSSSAHAGCSQIPLRHSNSSARR